MKKLSEIGQQKPANDGVPADSEEQSAKRLKVTDELRYFWSICIAPFKTNRIYVLHFTDVCMLLLLLVMLLLIVKNVV